MMAIMYTKQQVARVLVYAVAAASGAAGVKLGIDEGSAVEIVTAAITLGAAILAALNTPRGERPKRAA